MFRLKIAFSLFFTTVIGSASLEAHETMEYEQAIHLKGDPAKGQQLYQLCTACHGPEGWGNPSGSYPQIAGQLPTVLIKQLADFRAGNRDNPIMLPFADQRVLPTAQAIADITTYISQLPMNPSNGKGPGLEPGRGQTLYEAECAECHADNGEGNAEFHIPALHGQHFQYLRRQFEWIRLGKRRNADPRMVEQIQNISSGDMLLILDYASRLSPPKKKIAATGWRNPDFPNFRYDHFQQNIGPYSPPSSP